jgi:hypothetical protein
MRRDAKEVNTKVDLLKSSFKIIKVVQVPHEDDHDTISGKMGDFTSETTNKQITSGWIS